MQRTWELSFYLQIFPDNLKLFEKIKFTFLKITYKINGIIRKNTVSEYFLGAK